MKMTDEQLKAVLDNYIDDSHSNAYREVDGDVQRATDYYLGRPLW